MAKGILHATEQPIMKVFSDEYTFTVPGYQRPYAWTTHEAGALLDDLMAFMDDGKLDIGNLDPGFLDNLDPYFLGSIVLIKDAQEADAQIVDGQQRLATLTILLAVLRALAPKKEAADLTEFIAQEGNSFAGRQDVYRLTLRKRDAEFFRTNVQEVGGIERLKGLGEHSLEDDSPKLMRDNAVHFLTELEGLSEAQRKLLAQFIVQRCFLVVVSSPDDDAAFRIFEVLNDRGLDLTNADKLKAQVIGSIPDELQDACQKVWEQREVDLGRDDFNNLFAYIRMIYAKAKSRATLLRDIRDKVLSEHTPVDFVNKVLVPYADAFDTIKNAAYRDSKYAKQLNALFRWLNGIDNSDWLPPAILFLSRYGNDPEALLEFFKDLERLAAGMMIQRTFINKRIERYGQLLKTIEDGHRDELYAEGSPLQLTAEERLTITQVLDGNIYQVPRVPRYVLLRLNSALADPDIEVVFDFPIPIITIEHVLPQQPSPSSMWMVWFPTPELRDEYVHRLGNLVLLSRRFNSRAQNYDFIQKKSKYFDEGAGSPFVLTAGVLKEHEWTPQVVEQRQRRFVSRLKQIWRL